MRHTMTLIRIALCAIGLAGCAAGTGSGSTDGLAGTSGPVAWHITDIGQLRSLDDQRTRWTFVVLLREVAGGRIRFSRYEIRSSILGGGDTVGGFGEEAFDQTLAPRSEIRVPLSHSWGWSRSVSWQFGGTASLRTIRVTYRFVGTDDNGRAVSVLVPITLDRGIGTLTTPLPVTAPLPPRRELTPSDAQSLSGLWRGAYRTMIGANEFDVPAEVTVQADGTFDGGENAPVTSRFRGSLRIQDGRVAYSTRNDTGVLTLHEGEGKRVLVGEFSGPRGAKRETVSYRIRLEAVQTAAAATSAASPLSPSQPSVAPAPAIATSVRGLVTGTYRGTLSGTQAGRSYSADITATLVQAGDRVSGTWMTVGRNGTVTGSGTLDGTIGAEASVTFRVVQAHPCARELAGTGTVGGGGATLGGGYGGEGCNGPVTATFTLIRQ